MIFELWDTATMNLVGSYESEAAALNVVRGAVERYGAGYAEGLALVRENARGESRTLAEGRALLQYVEAKAPALGVADR
jgi:hypothetical protein